ncbi:MAG: YHYH protein [Flavobacteriales bacterium]
MKKLMIPILLLSLITACSSDDDSDTDDTSSDTATTSDFTKLYEKMYNITSIDYSGSSSVVIKTTDVPDHKSPFFGKTHAKYEAYNGDNPDFSTAINLMGTVSDPTLLSQSYTFTLPKNPSKASTHSSTSGGAMGIGRNGVVFFNQYNGAGASLDALEINNADQYLGHPTPSAGTSGAIYHYHYEPKYLTATFGNSAFMGFLLDGYPIYGPYENGVKITTDMLDEYNGHVSSTEDYPNDKIYHYHVISASSSVASELTKAAPYINGGKYYGTKGTVN